jgi:hypothetical protein
MTTEHRTVTAVGARAGINKCIDKKRPVFLWGAPGIGKSDVVASIAAERNGLLIDLRLGQMEPTDIRGIPFYNKDNSKMEWAPPSELPDEELASKYPIVILFLDELNSAAPSVQAAAYQLILNRRIGKYVLPDNVVMIAAGNRESDRGVTYRMPTPLSNRFIHLEMRADFPAWLQWATENRIHKDVVGYLSYAKQDLYDFDSKSISRAFATPRSWSFVSELLDGENDTNPTTITDLIAGTIGEGLAMKFVAHRKISGNLPLAEDILSGKVTTLEVKEISAMYSLVTNLCYELADASKKLNATEFHVISSNFFQYMMDNFETELVIMGTRTALVTFKLPIEATKLKNFDQFYAKYGKYVLQSVE